MKTRSTNLVQACNIVSAVTLLLIAVYQFLPFWFDGNVVASIQDYVWFPKEYKELTSYFKEVTGDPAFRVNDITLMPVLILAGSVLGILFCTLKSRSIVSAVFPAACGIIGIYGYLSSPVFQVFEYWWIHVALCAEMILVSAFTFYIFFAKGKKQ